MNVDVQVSCHPHIVRADYRFLQRLGSKLLVLSCMLLVTGSIAVAQTWQHEMLDSGSDHDVGQFSALAIDRDGNLHAAYWDATGNAPRGQLWYTFRAPGDKQWSRMVVDGDGTFVSMAVDGSDHPHIAYSSKRETGLHYAHFDGKKWQKQIIDPGKVNYYNQIQVDANGHPRISYR